MKYLKWQLPGQPRRQTCLFRTRRVTEQRPVLLTEKRLGTAAADARLPRGYHTRLCALALNLKTKRRAEERNMSLELSCAKSQEVLEDQGDRLRDPEASLSGSLSLDIKDSTITTHGIKFKKESIQGNNKGTVILAQFQLLPHK